MAEEDDGLWTQVRELVWGCALAQAIHVVVELEIPELLATGPRSIEQIALASEADGWTLETVLRALVAYGLLSLEADSYGLTRMGRFLLKSSRAGSAGDAGEFFETIYRPLDGLLRMVRTGEVAFDQVYGKSFYSYLSEQPALAQSFYDMMEANAASRYAELASVYDFSTASRLVDVGGGEGSLLVQMLRQHERLTGILFDLQVVADRARARIAAAGLTQRCEVIAGNFLESVPRGGDVYILAQILNNWRDAEARAVLANCRAAMNPGARLLVLEPIAFPGQVPRWRTLVSLGVMAQRGGRTRSEAQLRALLSASGFQVRDISRLPSSETYALTASPA